MIQYEIYYENERYELTWVETDDFSKIKPIGQVYCVCFRDDGKILIININKKWTLPGGKPEKNESFIETLKREVAEEGDVELSKITPPWLCKGNKNKWK